MRILALPLAGVILAGIGCGARSANQQAEPTSGPAVVVAEPDPQSGDDSPTPGVGSTRARSASTTTASGLGIEQLARGSGATAQPGHRVVVHYVGRLPDGTEFDSSRARGTPFTFDLGKGHVIPGFEEGVTGMQVGDQRRLTIPPELGYGERGSPGKIPPGATLIFEIELLAVE